jgi:molybdate transport system substrate-binding protein
MRQATRTTTRGNAHAAAGILATALLLTACGSTVSGDAGGGPTPEGLTIAAASQLAPVLDELVAAFTADTGAEVTVVLGSSGRLRQQIVAGAPYDLFLSADRDAVDAVVDAGRGLADTVTPYARGRLVLWASDPSRLPVDVAGLAGPDVRRVAIANPDHAPYGRAAVQALASAGVLEALADRLVTADSVADALTVARSGNVDVGVVALSLAIAQGGAWVAVPAALHDPIDQAMVVTAQDPARAALARRFVALVTGPEGRAVLERFGFDPPGGAS